MMKSSKDKQEKDKKDKPEKKEKTSALSFLTRKRSNTTVAPPATNPVPPTGPPMNDASQLSGSLNNMKITQKEPAKDKKEDEKKLKKSSSKDDKEENKSSIPVEKIFHKVNGHTYASDRVVGSGSFGVVVRATCAETNDVVAIKKVLQDKRYKNRELQIMQMLNHTNVVKLIDSFYTSEKPGTDEVYLNLVLEFIPDTVYRVCRHYTKLKQFLPLIYAKLYTYQMLRSLCYIHTIGVCHRDIKPQNLLLNPTTGILKLCDFGSAKILVSGEPNVSYICSRYYRAPELIFGSTTYTTTIDIWSAGCVMAELLLGQPLFPGESGVDQLVEIIKILGTPTREEIHSMNPNYTEYKFPPIKGHPWAKVFKARDVPQEAIDLISGLLQYTPTNRLKPMEALAHPFFDELRNANTLLPNGRPLPALFNFSEAEVKEAGPVLHKIIPTHAISQLQIKDPAGYMASLPQPPPKTTTTSTKQEV